MNDSTSNCHDAVYGGGRVIDSATIEALRELGGEEDPSLVTELIELYLDDAADRVRTLSAAWEDGDLSSVAGAAHALKSASASIGALCFSATCKDVEHGAKAGDPSMIAEPVAACVAMFREVQTALELMRADS